MTATPLVSDPRQVSALVDELTSATWTLAAIAALFESDLAIALREPRTLDELAARVPALPRERIACILDVAAGRGLVGGDGERHVLAPGAVPFVEPTRRTQLRGELRSVLMQALAYVDASTQQSPARGWYHTNPRLLQAQGDGSAAFAGALAGPLGGAFDGLVERLARPGARFLDVGVGVGSLSIAMCRHFPEVHVVGLDVYDVPLAIARDNVARAELAERIELRQLAVEDLRDEAAFDLVWLPACFLTASSLPAAIARVRAALRPGGWVIMPALRGDATDAQRRVASLVLEQWGLITGAGAMVAELAAGGFAAPRSVPGPGWLALVAGQR